MSNSTGTTNKQRTLEDLQRELKEANDSYNSYNGKLGDSDPNIARAAKFYTNKYADEIRALKMEEQALLRQEAAENQISGGGRSGRETVSSEQVAASYTLPYEEKTNRGSAFKPQTTEQKRTLDDIYADMDAANTSYDAYTDKLSSTDPNVVRAAQYFAPLYANQIKDLKKEEKELLDVQRGHKMTTEESALYSTERMGAGLLGMGEAVTDFIGGRANKAAQGVTSLFGLAPNKLSDAFGAGAQRFEDNSITRDVEQSIFNKYRPTRDQQNNTRLGQMALELVVGGAAAEKGIRAAGTATDAIMAAKTGLPAETIRLEGLAGKYNKMYNAGKETVSPVVKSNADSEHSRFLEGFFDNAQEVQTAEARIAARAKEAAKESFDITGSRFADEAIEGAGDAGRYFKDKQLKTEPNTAYFWSGNSNGIGGKDFAMDHASKNGGTTLEGLMKSQGIEMPTWDIADQSSKKAWEYASGKYAGQVSGDVHALIGATQRENSIWRTIELPRLMDNPYVSKIILVDPENLTETIIFRRQI